MKIFVICTSLFSESASNSLMIIFNGMYFRGSWKHPFDVVEPGIFYMSSSEKKQVTMMKARRVFKTAFLPELDSEAVTIPYDVRSILTL